MIDNSTSPYINRFLQPDSIIPNPANPQSLNRFGYVLNNPLRFSDPTGHRNCEEDGFKCENVELVNKIQNKYKNITIKNIYSWNLKDLKEIDSGLNMIMGKNGFNGNTNAFGNAFGQVTFNPVPNRSLDIYENGKLVKVNANADYKTGLINVTPNANDETIVHEMGHILSGSLKRQNERVSSYREMYSHVFDGGQGATAYGQDAGPVEDFADSFLVVIRDGPYTSNIDQPRVSTVLAIIQSYTNSEDNALYPGR